MRQVNPFAPALGVMLCVGLSCVGPHQPTQPTDHAIEIPGGSGVVVAPGWVLTAKHVVASWRKQGFEVAFSTDHPTLDVALVEWPTGEKTAAQIAPGSTKRGQEVSLVGIVQGRSEIHTRGHTGFLRLKPGMNVHSCPAGYGTSGSPLFDTKGRLVGIHIGAYYFNGPIGPELSTSEQLFVEISAIKEWLDAVL